MSDTHEQLSREIKDFLAKHAKRSAEDPESYSSPDAYELDARAMHLDFHGSLAGTLVPWSDWGSGGYAPYEDDKAREWHDSLVDRIKRQIEQDNRNAR